MSRIFCEIFCGHFPWKLKDENLRKISPKFRRIFRRSLRKILQELRSGGSRAQLNALQRCWHARDCCTQAGPVSHYHSQFPSERKGWCVFMLPSWRWHQQARWKRENAWRRALVIMQHRKSQSRRFSFAGVKSQGDSPEDLDLDLNPDRGP